MTMSIGSGEVLGAPPQISQHRVNVTGLDQDGFFLYDGASTWRGDSGGALLFEEGFVVGLHLEVVDDKPDAVLWRAAASPLRKQRRRDPQGTEQGRGCRFGCG